MKNFQYSIIIGVSHYNTYGVVRALGEQGIKSILIILGDTRSFIYHPNTMNENDFIYCENFLKTSREKFIGFDELPLEKLHGKSLAGKLANFAYLTMRRIKDIL